MEEEKAVVSGAQPASGRAPTLTQALSALVYTRLKAKLPTLKAKLPTLEMKMLTLDEDAVMRNKEAHPLALCCCIQKAYDGCGVQFE